MRWFLFAIGLSLLAGQPAFAQIVFPQSKQAGSTVTILSYGLAEPDSRAFHILSELSILLDNEGELRALTVNGYGGPSNVRDLLQLRGAIWRSLITTRSPISISPKRSPKPAERSALSRRCSISACFCSRARASKRQPA